jgi:hypothetical protein
VLVSPFARSHSTPHYCIHLERLQSSTDSHLPSLIGCLCVGTQGGVCEHVYDEDKSGHRREAHCGGLETF